MLQATELTKKYGKFTALNALNLSVKKGDIFCLLGANGAGKSTTINLFLNFIEPTGGKATINALDVTQHGKATKKLLSYIPENLMLYPNLTGLENLDFFCGLGGKSYSKDHLEELLKQSGLQTNFLHKRVSNYSKGMRQKVGIALARAREASVLLLDEPTSGLDPKASNEFSELLLDMKDKGVATLMATHDLFRAKDTGTHIGIMKEGILIEQFASDDVSFQDLEKLYLKHMHN
ncbi:MULTISPECIES: ABC transporter ATP-binding protein [Reichenbachiella]|uniref:ABC-2 type transport system ATP-binding protein n=1 Tax=Reichenbachiella agariperforans TaxID=156994 RepID=A0A1M6UCU1_REIAG|nr:MULTISPECIES: ABC transporter ATP-binding protein [Reichenbachiella]MBU2912577.1 ABC transporter ATP-binding protein [Reichenbachiella agariperforans]RJE72568.1 ABC transporter ATP-binding protein [Reichenbachiella sp. MSK19-1]SHK66996.1 ABC-2 type transport system ATP-binding protein [Reichenbachiella agariperforans]